MAISNYGELKTAVATWLDRSDLTSLIPDFITLAATSIIYGVETPVAMSEPLRVRGMETSADITITTGTGSLPTGFVQARRVYLDGSPVQGLEFIAPFEFWKRRGASEAGRPVGYTLEGDSLLTLPTTDTTYTVKMLYYKAFTALSGDTATDWLLANAPGVYLNMTLYEAYSYMGAESKAVGFLGRAAGTINALNNADKMDRFSGSPLRAVAETAP